MQGSEGMDEKVVRRADAKAWALQQKQSVARGRLGLAPTDADVVGVGAERGRAWRARSWAGGGVV